MAVQFITIFIGFSIGSASILAKNQKGNEAPMSRQPKKDIGPSILTVPKVLGDTHIGSVVDTPVLKSHMDPPGKHGNHLNVPVEHIETGQTQLLGTLVSGAGSFGELVGMALPNHQNKTSHVDPPGVHNNFLDIPVEHVVTDQGPRVGSHKVDIVQQAAKQQSDAADSSVSPLELKLSQLLKDIQVDLFVPVSFSETNLEPTMDVIVGSTDMTDSKVTAGDYMSSLVQAYGRTRQTQNIKPKVTELRPNIDNPPKHGTIIENSSIQSPNPSEHLPGLSQLDLELSHLLKDIQVDLASPDSLEENSPGSLPEPNIATAPRGLLEPQIAIASGALKTSINNPLKHKIENPSIQSPNPNALLSGLSPLDIELSHLLKDIHIDLASPVSIPENIPDSLPEPHIATVPVVVPETHIGTTPGGLPEPIQSAKLNTAQRKTRKINRKKIRQAIRKARRHKMKLKGITPGGLPGPIQSAKLNTAQSKTRKINRNKIRKAIRKARRQKKKLNGLPIDTHIIQKHKANVFPNVLPGPHIAISPGDLQEPRIAVADGNLPKSISNAEPVTAQSKARQNMKNKMKTMRVMRQKKRLVAKLRRLQRILIKRRRRPFRNIRKMPE